MASPASLKNPASSSNPASPQAIGSVDQLLAEGGLLHGRRATRKGSWAGGERVRRAKTDLPQPVITKLDSRRGLLQTPAFEKPGWLHAGFSTREGGKTTVYAEQPTVPGPRRGRTAAQKAAAEKPAPGELNLGWTAHDDEAIVAANRKRFAGWVADGAKLELVTMRQFHSGLIRIIEKDHGPLVTPDGRAVLRGDALMTDVPGLLLGVQTADCVPVLLADVKKKAVAVFHAGWRGTLARIVERGVGTMRLRYGSRPQDLVAAIGPAIGPCCFSVGEEVKFEFESQFAYSPELFYDVYDSDPIRDKYPMLFLTQRAPGHSNLGPQLHLDLFEANRRQLLDAGVKPKNITVSGECTACTRLKSGARKYFSHRAEHGFTGRMMSVIGISE